MPIPPHGFLNVHPSLLPAYRGPAPLFWQLRAGETQTGVTVHWMEERFDAGPIAMQQAVSLPDGISGAQADALLAHAGGQLLADALAAIAVGNISPLQQPPGGSYQPWPTDESFAISTTWPARRVFNFMRGTAEWGAPYWLEIDGMQWQLAEALAWSSDEKMDRKVVVDGNTVVFQCAPGTVCARWEERS